MTTAETPVAIVNALWRARAFIQEGHHEDRRFQRDVFEEVDALLSEVDPEHHARIIAEESEAA